MRGRRIEAGSGGIDVSGGLIVVRCARTGRGDGVTDMASDRIGGCCLVIRVSYRETAQLPEPRTRRWYAGNNFRRHELGDPSLRSE